MPDCSENYEGEIQDGFNIRSIKCKYCNSTILKPLTATFTTIEFQLPFMKQITGEDVGTEDLSLFWLVADMLIFENVGFSNTVGNNKYLICADCESGPIGYFDVISKKSYVALNRIKHC
ncbi:hypothetical protein PPYR_02467 [Photinus pyralis]|uniref:Guanine nucleotide exchange factor MSS4 homolog n=1 Tax=Photinus pyralis TaxID=7054 RepID=A0A1Y1LIK5_PHOPY|nr:guanine nucleotide exchange factor MSS4 homolog [Photinus pyralis]KAB0805497.1 hypothetical protein PPYR_02467 [Photinus pyralis]